MYAEYLTIILADNFKICKMFIQPILRRSKNISTKLVLLNFLRSNVTYWGYIYYLYLTTLYIVIIYITS